MPLINLFIFIFGLMIGSFLNVLIYRLPENRNWISERSFCRTCGEKISIFRNIPFLSFLIQKGKCHYCGAKISFQYPFIELLVGLSAVLLFPKYPTLDNLINYFFLISILSCFIVHFVIDLRHHILPDGINLYLAILFTCYGVIHFPYLHCILGGFIGFFIPYLVALIFYKLKGVEGLGGGDIKLFGALGIYLGPQGIMGNIFLSCFFGSIVGVSLIILKKLDKQKPLAFGPFILITAFFQIFFPDLVQKFSKIVGLAF